MKIHDVTSQRALLNANLSRKHRSLVTKLKAGVLSLKVLTGRFKGADPVLRVCDLCNSGEWEDEMYYLYRCSAIEPARKPFINKMKVKIEGFDNHSEEERTKISLSAQHIKMTARWFEEMYSYRFDKLNQKV